MKRDRQAPILAAEVDTPELALTCSPAEVLNLVRTDHGGILATKLLAVFYCFADSIGKTIEDLKAKCRPLIIARRNEGTPTGPEKQHREFVYQIPAGEVAVNRPGTNGAANRPREIRVTLENQRLVERCNLARHGKSEHSV